MPLDTTVRRRIFRQSIPKKFHALLDQVMSIHKDIRTEETLKFLKRLAKKQPYLPGGTKYDQEQTWLHHHDHADEPRDGREL